MHLFFIAILYCSGNSSINISLTSKAHKAGSHVPLCSPLDPQNLAQCLAESRCHRKNKGREEIGHSTSPLHSSKMKFPILCLKVKINQIRYVRRNFPTYGSLVGGCICRNVLTVNMKPPLLMLSIEEDSTELQREPPSRAESKTFSTSMDQEKWVTNMPSVGHSHVSPFSARMSPGLKLKHMKEEFLEILLFFSPISESWEHILSETTVRERHPPYSPFPQVCTWQFKPRSTD